MNVLSYARSTRSRYKKRINCSNPKGFSQKAHCQGRKKRLKETHNEGLVNYMFFSNLDQIERQCKMLRQIDKSQIDQILSDGHDWADDHISEAKNNMDQVFDFLKNETEGEGDYEEDDNEMIKFKGKSLSFQIAFNTLLKNEIIIEDNE